MFKRIGLLILANLAIFIMLSVILTVVQMVFGINFGTMAGSNLNLGTLFIFAMVVGFSGSIISLLASKMMAKMTMGLTMIDVNNPRNRVEQYVVETVRKLANEAGLPMPEVAIYEGEPNAFATGPSRSNSLVAVSTGLLSSMNAQEVEAAAEPIRLNDEQQAAFLRMLAECRAGEAGVTLLQGVMNTFVFFLSRIIGWVVDRQILRNEDEGPGVGYYVTSLVLDICLGFLASMVVAYFSRWREYHADAGAADLMHDTTPMINALQRLGGMEPNELPGAVKGFGISGGIGSLFASHPSIEDRVQALREHRYTAN